MLFLINIVDAHTADESPDSAHIAQDCEMEALEGYNLSFHVAGVFIILECLRRSGLEIGQMNRWLNRLCKS